MIQSECTYLLRRQMKHLRGFEMNLFGFEASLANAQCLPDAQRQCIFTQERAT